MVLLGSTENVSTAHGQAEKQISKKKKTKEIDTKECN